MRQRGLSSILDAIRDHAGAGRVRFTLKALHELEQLELGLDERDVCDVLSALRPNDFIGRLVSHITHEWMYIFAPDVGGVSVYLKLVLRRNCVVISFHELEGARNNDDDKE